MSEQKNLEQGSFAGLLLRLYWMGIGNFIPIIAVVWAFKSNHNPKLPFILLIVAPAASIIARYLDIKFCNGMTADASALATMSHFRRYTLTLVLVYAAIMGVVFLVTHFMLGSA